MRDGWIEGPGACAKVQLSTDNQLLNRMGSLVQTHLRRKDKDATEGGAQSVFSVEMFMSSNRFNGFSNHGVGIGLRIPHYKEIFSRKPVVDWFEIISENFMCDAGRPMQVLERILEQYRVVQHGVSMYFGSVTEPDAEHMKRLKQLVKRTGTPWLSDHLCWGSVDGNYTHDLLPLPYTWEAVERTVERVKRTQDTLEIPVAVENVSSYAAYHDSEMTEWEFLNEVVERADCGILLDVNKFMCRGDESRV